MGPNRGVLYSRTRRSGRGGDGNEKRGYREREVFRGRESSLTLLDLQVPLGTIFFRINNSVHK